MFNVLDLGNNTQQSRKTKTATLNTLLAYLCMNGVLMHEQKHFKVILFILRVNYDSSSLTRKIVEILKLALFTKPEPK